MVPIAEAAAPAIAVSPDRYEGIGPAQIVRVVVDTLQQCNLRCTYCHPGRTWEELHLPGRVVHQVLEAAAAAHVLEVVLPGGEILLHPDLDEILDATVQVRRTACTMITNATVLTADIAKRIGCSGISRVCLSLDGPDAAANDLARGRTYTQVMRGLEEVSRTAKPLTVISVVHSGNYRRVFELSDRLHAEGIVSQHHLCAPSFSGSARSGYSRLSLSLDEFESVQAGVDERHAAYLADDFVLTFNSYWPATGRYSRAEAPRLMTLQQLTEQAKDTYVLVRPNGDFRLTCASWGRESLGNPTIGNVLSTAPKKLLDLASRHYQAGQLQQLPREVEARHKFLIGSNVDGQLTARLIDAGPDEELAPGFIPLISLAASPLAMRPLDVSAVKSFTSRAGALVHMRHLSGVDLLFDPSRSRVAVLRDGEMDLELAATEILR